MPGVQITMCENAEIGPQCVAVQPAPPLHIGCKPDPKIEPRLVEGDVARHVQVVAGRQSQRVGKEQVEIVCHRPSTSVAVPPTRSLPFELNVALHDAVAGQL
ncbi:MAG: hypothetical protein EA404_14140 [Spirochaetaceae bacterium]|nr:MAG: hypothetical protein EA404_14140 [Spirochaetaceae bacterium]